MKCRPLFASARTRVALFSFLFTLAANAQAAVTEVAWWRLGENDPGAANGGIATDTKNLVGGTLNLVPTAVYTNAISANASTSAGSTIGLNFSSGSYGTNALVSTLTDNFGLELWVRPDDTNGTQCLAYNGHSASSGWGLYLSGGQFRALLGGVVLFGNTPAVANTWTHLALVRHNGTNLFYVDGVPTVTNTSVPIPPAGRFTVAVTPQTLNAEFFAGSLDEVRVFSFEPGAFNPNDLLYFTAPAFVNVPLVNLPGVDSSSVAWGDYDNDGRLDFLLTGGGGNSRVSQLWRNTGSGFANVTDSVAPGLPGILFSSVAWGDYDNDGRLDFLLTGYPGISQLWRNQGSGFVNVTDSIAPGLPGVASSSVAWGDFDNDGRLDFLLTGGIVSGRVSQLWRNTGSGFTQVTDRIAPDLPGVQLSSVAWGDYDNDGRLDFLLTGSSNGISSGAIAQLWRNTGSGFTNVTARIAPGLPGVYLSSVAWGDYDNDGRLDFLLTGWAAVNPISQLWRNTGSGFTNVTTSVAPGLPGVYHSSVAWGDYDNDGRLDFLLTGGSENSRISQLWRNTGSGFTNVTGSVLSGLRGVDFSSVAWGDYDNDGRLDFLLTGTTAVNVGTSQLWRNVTPSANTPPSAPTGLSVAASGGGFTFSWGAASDGQTPANGLAYHLRVGTTPGGSDLLAPMAAANGQSRLPRSTTLQPTRSRTITSLPTGRPIYWSVQAADAAFAGSPFAAEQSFAVSGIITPANGILTPGDTNGDGVVSPAEFAAVRAALANELATQNAAGYYTLAQVHALNIGTPLVSQTASGQFKLTLGLQKATQLTNFVAFPFLAPQCTINGQGQLEFIFTSPDSAAFYRLEAQ